MAFTLDTDPNRVDIDAVHRFLSEESYWARGIPRETVVLCIAGSRVFALYDDATGALAAFARVITDDATFAYLCDVFVVSEHRGQGLSKRLMDAIVATLEPLGLRRWMLFTRDAHTLYTRYGFTPMPHPENALQRHDPDVYNRV
jgi:GNAT superfamily N-acetyltransferase